MSEDNIMLDDDITQDHDNSSPTLHDPNAQETHTFSREIDITESGIKYNYIFLPKNFIVESGMSPGRYQISVEGIDKNLSGSLQNNGVLTGLNKFYALYGVKIGDRVTVEVNGSTVRLIAQNIANHDEHTTPSTDPEPEPEIATLSEKDPGTQQEEPEEPVLRKFRARHIHLEKFSPGNIAYWNPANETDIYFIFGAMSRYLDYRYICGVSADLLRKLDIDRHCQSKPDAILVNRRTDEYVIGEFKVKSSDFTSNHNKSYIDVLICWDDDVTDPTERQSLPLVVSLRNAVKGAIDNDVIDFDDEDWM